MTGWGASDRPPGRRVFRPDQPVSERVSTVSPKPVAQQPVVRYDERLHVPLRWWVQATMFLATVWIAFIVSIPSAVLAWAATGALTALVLGVLLGYGAARVTVDEDWFCAGRARIPVSLLADPVALDAESTRARTGVAADARAFLVLRPYLKRSVVVSVTDPRDPTPYWLVSTRRPDQLVAALSAAMEASQKG